MSAWNKEACLSQVAVESDLHEEPASIPGSSAAHPRGGISESECIKDRSSLQVECRKSIG